MVNRNEEATVKTFNQKTIFEALAMPTFTGNIGIPALLYSFIFLIASPQRWPGVQRKSSMATSSGIKLSC